MSPIRLAELQPQWSEENAQFAFGTED